MSDPYMTVVSARRMREAAALGVFLSVRNAAIVGTKSARVDPNGEAMRVTIGIAWWAWLLFPIVYLNLRRVIRTALREMRVAGSFTLRIKTK